MNAHRGIEAQHPHFVHIPDPKQVEGVRAYREPDQPLPLQVTFLEEAGERAWVGQMRELLSAGQILEADARLSAEIAGFDGALARICKATSAAEVALEGWDDLLPILSEWEGPQITAITVGLTNPPDLVFEAGQSHDPELLLGLYSDDAFSFSAASRTELLDECAKELPAWTGAEEDVEFYCTLPGLAELNSALINCKHRRFLRDGRDGVEARAPGGYVEYVLGSWMLATRFLQATERAILDHGLPPGCRLIAGAVDVNADFVTILGGERQASTFPAGSSEPAFAPLTFTPWVPREDPTADMASSGPTLRQRLVSAEQAGIVEATEEEPARASFLTRLFGRFRRG